MTTLFALICFAIAAGMAAMVRHDARIHRFDRYTFANASFGTAHVLFGLWVLL